MLRAPVIGVVLAVLLFGACGEDDAHVQIPPDSGAHDVTVGDDAADATPNDDGASDGATDGGGDAPSDVDSAADAGDASDSSSDAGVDSGIPTTTLVLDEPLGANTYGGGLNPGGNWVSSYLTVNANAGTQWFGSGNGSNNTFPNLYFKKNLGGSVQNRTYDVSFYIVWDEGGAIGPVQFSDFTVLRIGGANGTVNWTSTPTPSVVGVWVKWTGTYTPAPADLGGPFYFEIKFDLPSKHIVGFDGPIGIE